VRGVCWHRGNQMWHAQITIASKRKSLGYFHSVDLAAAAFEREHRTIYPELYAEQAVHD
jgi:hypothetical protein